MDSGNVRAPVTPPAGMQPAIGRLGNSPLGHASDVPSKCQAAPVSRIRLSVGASLCCERRR